jgi:hypothetical protein
MEEQMIKEQIHLSFIKISAILAASAFITIIAVDFLLASDKQDMPETITLENKACGNSRGPVEFAHVTHAEDYGISCNECHHYYENGKNIWKEEDGVNKCIECHDSCKSDGKVKKLELAFHKNCKECHRKMATEQGATNAPFRACKDCHKRK